jgi:outer membrane receptor for ferrienterochelin and colicin
MEIKRQIISSFLAMALVLSAPIGHAADGEMEAFFSMSPAELAEISVSIATGTPRPNHQAAGSISVITAEQIRAMGATELHEVLETVPGIHASMQPMSNDLHYTIRGLANVNNAQILFLLNGTRITTAFRGSTESSIDMPLAAIERVEVIRGPASAVYGADAFAGVINIITKKAQDINGTQLGARAGNWDTQSGWGQHGTEWAGWDIATSVQYQHTDGDNGMVIEQDSQTLFDRAFGTNASHAPGEMNTRYHALNTHVNLKRKHWDLGFWAFNGLDIGTRSGAAGALDPKGTADSAQYLGDMRFSTEDWFDDWEFLAHLSYLHSDVSAKVNLFPDNALLPTDANGDISQNPVSLVRFSNGVIEDIRHVQKVPAIELTSLYKGLDKHLFRLNSGFRYEELNVIHLSNYSYGKILPPVVDATLINKTGTPFAFLKDANRTVASVMLQDEWQLADDWQLTAGVRYDHYSDFGGTVNPRFALVWDINGQLTSKLLYGRAFRAPSFFELGIQNSTVNLGNMNLKPETINTVEWAFDYRLSSALRTGLNLYYYHINDFITISPTLTRPEILQYNNFGNLDGHGFEWEWNWKLSEQWNIAGNYAWQHVHNDQTDRRISGVPEHQIYFAGIWQFMPQWQFQSQLNWLDGRARDPGDNRPLDDYETVDFTLRGKKLWGHVNLAASLRNAFDSNNLEPAGFPSAVLPANLPLPGRSFYFEASVDF